MCTVYTPYVSPATASLQASSLAGRRILPARLTRPLYVACGSLPLAQRCGMSRTCHVIILPAGCYIVGQVQDTSRALPGLVTTASWPIMMIHSEVRTVPCSTVLPQACGTTPLASSSSRAATRMVAQRCLVVVFPPGSNLSSCGATHMVFLAHGSWPWVHLLARRSNEPDSILPTGTLHPVGCGIPPGFASQLPGGIRLLAVHSCAEYTQSRLE